MLTDDPDPPIQLDASTQDVYVPVPQVHSSLHDVGKYMLLVSFGSLAGLQLVPSDAGDFRQR